MKNYQTVPVVVQALQFNGENFADVELFTNHTAKKVNDYIVIPEQRGDVKCFAGCYIVKFADGWLRSYTEETFNAEFQPVIEPGEPQHPA